MPSAESEYFVLFYTKKKVCYLWKYYSVYIHMYDYHYALFGLLIFMRIQLVLLNKEVGDSIKLLLHDASFCLSFHFERRVSGLFWTVAL